VHYVRLPLLLFEAAAAAAADAEL